MAGAQPIARTLRILSYLLSYPGTAWRANLRDLRHAIEDDRVLAKRRRLELLRLVDGIAAADPIEAEAAYLEVFDRGRATSLHLFEHVHGDSRDRGPALTDLGQTYAQAGLDLAAGELPDYLPAVLEFASTQPPREARALLGEMAHILNALMTALTKRRSGYARVIGALLEIAGEKAVAVELPPEEPLDATWAEPPVFAGCSSPGQSRPDAPQPVQFVRNASRAQGATA
ncbi:MAG: nitrate reductase molybdenum cofactor assembly chaperone [Burkholderiales bacterium]